MGRHRWKHELLLLSGSFRRNKLGATARGQDAHELRPRGPPLLGVAPCPTSRSPPGTEPPEHPEQAPRLGRELRAAYRARCRDCARPWRERAAADLSAASRTPALCPGFLPPHAPPPRSPRPQRGSVGLRVLFPDPLLKMLRLASLRGAVL